MTLRSLKPALAATAVLAGALGAPAIATAGTTASTNWSGYAIHSSRVKFRKATGAWIEPSATCSGAQATAAAFWVGIGGYALHSPALFQDGTELDCSPDGRTNITAWYEFYPAASREIHRMTVRAGDTMDSTIKIVGKKVTLKLADLTRDESFSITRRKSTVDQTSAEWIAEAPEECGSRTCSIQPLTDFGTMEFSNAAAQTTNGRTGAISSSRYRTTKIDLRPEPGSSYSSDGTVGEATPSALLDGDRAFTDTFSTESAQPGELNSPFTEPAGTPTRTPSLFVPPLAR